MYEQVEKPKENKSEAIANSVTQNKSNKKQGFGFVDNRLELFAQRKLQEMASKSVQVSQLMPLKTVSSGYQYLEKQSNSKGHSLSQNNHTDNVLQLKDLKSGKMNMVGERHDKSSQRRDNEKILAKFNGLEYRTEADLYVRKDDLLGSSKFEAADPIEERILHMLAMIIEVRDERNILEESNAKVLKRLSSAMQSDLVRAYSSTAGKDNAIELSVKKEVLAKNNILRLSEINERFKGLLDASLAGDRNQVELVNVIDQMDQWFRLNAPSNVKVPKNNEQSEWKATSNDLQEKRSAQMHNMANKIKSQPVLWMVGDFHVQDINHMLMRGQVPPEKYNLIDKAEFWNKYGEQVMSGEGGEPEEIEKREEEEKEKNQRKEV
ncbi:MAG: hypothetical protein COB15_10950 [Flavobacteriales bacterium]|nr:MAG: hypothetical protein COB15_10950 [Flavobacteriales bacterium]